MGLHPYDKACMTEAGLPTDPPETLIKNLTSDNWRVQRPACVRLCEMSREELLPHFDSIFALLDHELWEVTHSAQTIFYEVFNADDLHPHLPKFLSLLEDLRKNAVRHSVLEMLDHKIDKGVLAGHVHLLFGSLEHKEWLRSCTRGMGEPGKAAEVRLNTQARLPSTCALNLPSPH